MEAGCQTNSVVNMRNILRNHINVSSNNYSHGVYQTYQPQIQDCQNIFESRNKWNDMFNGIPQMCFIIIPKCLIDDKIIVWMFST